MVGIGFAFTGMWLHLSAPALAARRPASPPSGSAPRSKRSLVGPIVYLFTVGLAFVSAEACFVVYALLAAYFVAGPSSRAATP